jgi:hypothetical protein
MAREMVIRAPPRRAGFVMWGPETRRVGGATPRGALSALAVALAVAVGACTSDSADQVTQPVDVGMTQMTPAYYSDGQLTLYQVEVPVALPVRKMTSADLRAVGAAPKGTPYPRGVFLRAEDESVEVRYTISNIDTTPHDVWLLIDPWNEFVRWRPGVTVIDDETTLPNFGYDIEFTVPGKQRIEGTITSDDVHEIAIKLAAVENLLASPQAPANAQGTTGNGYGATQIANNIFNPQNRSNSVPSDPIYTPWIPPVIAGVTGFDLGLRTTEKANVAVEVTIDVQDLRGDRFVLQDKKSDPQMGLPRQVLSPPGARF